MMRASSGLEAHGCGDAIEASSVAQMLVCQRVDSQLAGSPILTW